MSLLLAYLNYRGLTIVGRAALAMTAFIMCGPRKPCLERESNRNPHAVAPAVSDAPRPCMAMAAPLNFMQWHSSMLCLRMPAVQGQVFLKHIFRNLLLCMRAE